MLVFAAGITQWGILAIFGSLQNPDFTQILGPKRHFNFLSFKTRGNLFMSQKMGTFFPLCIDPIGDNAAKK